MSQYHLRKITKEEVETNHALGNQYTVIDREKNANQFTKTVEAYFKDGISEDIYCFVSSSFGQIFGLEKQGQAYIMTESGSTFSNLTHRK
jgi:hypothetical protein